MDRCRLEGPLKRVHLWKEDHDAYSDWVNRGGDADILRAEIQFGNEENGRQCSVEVHTWKYTNDDGDFDVVKKTSYTYAQFASDCEDVAPAWRRAVKPKTFLDTWLDISPSSRRHKKDETARRACYVYHSFTEVLELSDVQLQDRYFCEQSGSWRMRLRGEPKLSQEPDVYIPDTSAPYRPRYFSDYTGRWYSVAVDVNETRCGSLRSENRDGDASATHDSAEAEGMIGQTWKFDAVQRTWTYWLSEFELAGMTEEEPRQPRTGDIYTFPAMARNVAFRIHFSEQGFQKFQDIWESAKSARNDM